jgi:hypothetical protein
MRRQDWQPEIEAEKQRVKRNRTKQKTAAAIKPKLANLRLGVPLRKQLVREIKKGETQ